MQVGIVVAALRKHRLATFLIAMEIAMACAVLSNAIFMFMEKRRALNLISGVQESSLGVVQIVGFSTDNAADINARMVGAIQAIPGVQSVGVISAVPFGEPGVRAGVSTDEALERDGGVLDIYLGDAVALTSLGMTVVAGRMPEPAEYAPIGQYVPSNANVLMTQQLAHRYWPGESAVGRSLWTFGTRFTVVGVVDHFVVSQPGGGEALGNDWSLIVPAVAGPQLVGRYVVRARPEDLPRIFGQVGTAVSTAASEVVFDHSASRPLSELRSDYFRSAKVMMGLLAAVIIALLGATALGIVGLASYWVEQRRRQIGIRRALGATRSDILRYFQIENFLIVSIGITVGLILSCAMNLGLMRFYELPKLPLAYLPISAIVLWLLGQAAVLVPALKASAITPVQAIRSL
ncbi:MAG: ABC transporter permease [Stenotrophomonas sp.]|uniref:ABC transporter permease n=1 Tax=Stenotrophomonas sp. TaxID=69392 RepID=UPI003D6CF155